MKTKCICSSPTKEGLQKLINEFYFSTDWIITDDNKVCNTKLEKYDSDKFIVKVTKGRWQYRMIVS